MLASERKGRLKSKKGKEKGKEQVSKRKSRGKRRGEGGMLGAWEEGFGLGFAFGNFCEKKGGMGVMKRKGVYIGSLA